jgi:uncharacterized protein YjbJ (UPF0337 family)
MNWDTVKGDWKQFEGKVKEQWGKLTDDDLKRIEGRRDQLAGAIQKRYGIEKDEAERQVTAFEQTCEHGQNEENRPQMDSHGRETREKNTMGQSATNNPNKDRSESMPMRHDPRRQDEHSAQQNDPKFHREQGGSDERMKDKEMSGEKNMEGKQSASSQKQHSQPPRAKK